MIQRFSLTLGMTIILLLQAAICLAHGVDGYAAQANGYCITARYDDGEPMSWSEVRITAPDSDIEFQNGRTDRNGRFMFFPDRKGTWEITVQDGMGHRLALDIQVSPDDGGKEKVAPVTLAAGKNRPMGLVAGIAVIFGLCGFFYGWKARRDAV